MNIAKWLFQSARSWPKRPAVYFGSELILNYSELVVRTSSLARSLSDHYKIGKGDRVAIYTSNTLEYIEIIHAIWWIGGVVVPVNYKLHSKEAEWILEDSDASLVFTSSGDIFNDDAKIKEIGIETDCYKEIVNGEVRINPIAPMSLNGDVLAWLFYTSGTTGNPKGAMLSHSNLKYMTLCFGVDIDRPTIDDVSLYAAPMSHGAGLYCLPFIKAAAAHLVPISKGFNPEEIIELASNPGRLKFFAAPTMIKRLVNVAQEKKYSGEGISTIIYGGGPMYAVDIEEALETFGSKFVQLYGQGESPMTITALSRELVADKTHPNCKHRRASVGIPQSCVEVDIVDSNGERLPVECAGEIVVRSPTVMMGYWGREDSTCETIRNNWLHTGDIGYLDSDGFLTLTDRSKDVIISGGTNIYPREVEEVLLQYPSISEVAVIGLPDPEWGEKVVAFIVITEGLTCEEKELEMWCKTEIASFKKPSVYYFVNDLPKNSYGKVLKKELRMCSEC